MGVGLLVAVSSLLRAVATRARATAAVFSGGRLIGRARVSTSYLTGHGVRVIGRRAVGGSRSVWIAVSRSVMIGGSPLLR